VKSDIATTRPMVLTTRRGNEEKLSVKEEGGDFESLDKTQVVNWVTERMDMKFSAKKIFIEVTGPNYMNRRFVDLPGFQQNNDGTGTYKMILNLLRSELSNPNTVVVCVDTAKEFVNSNLVSAMKEVFGDRFSSDPDFAQRFVVTLNKSDDWLGSAETTPDVFLNQIDKYKTFFGMVPVLVGGSIDPSNRRLRESRAKGDAPFEDIVREYETANSRERAIYDSFQQRLDPKLSRCLLDKYVGFENFLGTVDRLVINRDFGNVDKISHELLKITDERRQELSALKMEQTVIEELDQKVSEFVTELLNTTNAIMTNDSGNNALGVLGSKDVINEVGMTAIEEETAFVNDYWNPNRRYDLYEHHEGCNAKFDRPDIHDINAWQHAVGHTIHKLRTPGMISSISYLHQKLIGGAMYERSLAVWASTAYNFLAPSEDDLDRLANVVGIDPEINTSNEVKKAKRLAEIYIGRLIPALQYLCQKMEFILLNIFDTAWHSLMRKDYYANIASAVGERFKSIVKDNYRQAVAKSARLAYNRAFFDLDNEVNKLLPYQAGSPSVTAMKFAFPGNKDNIERVMAIYHEKVSGSVKDHYSEELDMTSDSDGIGKQLKEGILLGIGLLADGGVISPLLFAGIVIMRAAVTAVSKSLQKKRMLAPSSGAQVMLAEDVDQKSLGFAVGLYSHFLPRFISSIDGRMRAEIWSSMKNTPLNETIKRGVVKNRLLSQMKSEHADIHVRVGNLGEQVNTLEMFRDDMKSFLSKRPPSQRQTTSGAIDMIYSRDDFFPSETQQFRNANMGGGIDLPENQPHNPQEQSPTRGSSLSDKEKNVPLEQRLAALRGKPPKLPAVS